MQARQTETVRGSNIGTKYLIGSHVLSPERGAIVALGDSITAGACAEYAYTDLLARHLRRPQIGSSLSVTNAGVRGDALVKILPRRLRSDVLQLSGVVGVILMIGTNDIGGGREMRPPPTPSSSPGGIQHVADSLIYAGLNVRVSLLPPSGDGLRPSLHVRTTPLRTGSGHDCKSTSGSGQANQSLPVA